MLRAIMLAVIRLIRTSLRSLLRAPGFSVVAVVTLAVGLSANAALFSVYDQLVLNPVTVPRAGSLVAIWARTTSSIQCAGRVVAPLRRDRAADEGRSRRSR